MKKFTVLLLLVLVFLSSCSVSGGVNVLPSKENNDGIVYQTFYIEGMPCMRIGRGMGSGVWEFDGVTCDWSKWEGNE